MMEDFLYRRLDRVNARQRESHLAVKLALCWIVAALLGGGLLLLQSEGFSFRFSWLVLLIGAFVGAVVVWQRARRQPVNYRQLAAEIEKTHPELQGVLLTAVQQKRVEGVEPGYLQYRVIQTAIAQSQESDWQDVVPKSRRFGAQAAQLAALAVFLVIAVSLRTPTAFGGALHLQSNEIVVTPGNTELERGESLVVLAKFGNSPPASVTLVLSEDRAATRQQPLIKSLADPIFGGSVPDVKNDLVYHIEYGGRRTPDYKVSVFEHPRLEQANVQLTFPKYTAQPPKRIDDTRRVSAVEGTTMDLTLQLNKVVKTAELVARNKEKTVIKLQVSPDHPTAAMPAMALSASQTYDLKLTDAEGRANKGTTAFVFDVVPNRPPEIKLTSPRGDTRPSALEEIAFAGTIWDDFGSPAFGLTYTLAGGETKTVELGKDTTAKEKRPFNYLLRLEELGVQPDQLLSWYVWADDIGPDGKTRRTKGDLFFAEVRPFEEVFKESHDTMSDDEQQQMQQSGGNTPAAKLTELQKQIINATWKLQRDPASARYAEDSSVVLQSQTQALEQAGEAASDAKAPAAQALWKVVTSQMNESTKHLKDAAKVPGPLLTALSSEQASYQALLKLRQRETRVSRSRNGKGGGGGDSQKQIDQLDLAQAENRYETQKQATAPQSPERREQSQVMNRLQELAHRQGDLNDRLKEMQTALQEAKGEEQKEEIRRQLKRLQEEQRQMLADLDELKQRMDRPENQSRLSEQRKQLEQTRDQLQQASDATGAGSVSQAVAAGTRAQRQLQDMRDELRKESSSQFADDLKQMRSDARELARQQEEISRQLGGSEGDKSQRKTLGGSSGDKNVLDQLAQQKERVKELVDKATEVSQQAESTEPLLSRQLYDSVRKLSQDDVKNVKDARSELLEQGMISRDLYTKLQQSEGSDEPGKTLDLTKELLNAGFQTQAADAGHRAAAGIDELRRGVENAAGTILGDDAEALKLAQSEIDTVTEQLQREMSQDGGKTPAATGAGGKQGESKAGKSPGRSNSPPGKGDERLAAGDQPNADRDATTENAAGPDASDNASAAGAGVGQNSSAQGKQKSQRGKSGDAKSKAAGVASTDANGQTGSADANPDSSAADAQPGEASSSGAPSSAASASGSTAQAGQSLSKAGARSLTGGPRNAGAQDGGGNAGGFDVGSAFNQNAGGVGGGGAWDPNGDLGPVTGPILGGDFGPWADRLRNVEEVLDDPRLRESVAAARERARQMRVDFRRDRKKPDWAVVQLQVLKPLLEVRNRITDELARRESKESLVPIDRDPVPNRYTDSVAKYYEELGKEKPGSQ